MWWTMTILTGRCMPLVGVQTPPSIVKATDMLHQPTLLPKRYTLPKLISSLDLDPEICYRSWRIRSIQYDLGDEASRNTRERMEGVELEIRRRYVVEWCLFHSIRCWSFSKLCQSLQLRSQICFHGWLHYFFCRFAPLPPRPSLLRQVLHHFNFKHQMLKSHRQKKAFPLSVWFPSSPFVPSHYNSHLTSTHFFSSQTSFHHCCSICWLLNLGLLQLKRKCHFRGRCRSVVLFLSFFFGSVLFTIFSSS